MLIVLDPIRCADTIRIDPLKSQSTLDVLVFKCLELASHLFLLILDVRELASKGFSFTANFCLLRTHENNFAVRSQVIDASVYHGSRVPPDFYPVAAFLASLFVLSDQRRQSWLRALFSTAQIEQF